MNPTMVHTLRTILVRTASSHSTGTGTGDVL